MEDDAELEAIKRRKLEGAHAEDEQRKVLVAALEPDAYSRMTNVAMSSPKMYQAVAAMVMNLIQSGQLRGRINDLQLKMLLSKLAARKPQGSISIRRK